MKHFNFYHWFCFVILMMVSTQMVYGFSDEVATNGACRNDKVHATYRATINGANITREVHRAQGYTGFDAYFEGTIHEGDALYASIQITGLSGTKEVKSYTVSIDIQGFDQMQTYDSPDGYGYNFGGEEMLGANAHYGEKFKAEGKLPSGSCTFSTDEWKEFRRYATCNDTYIEVTMHIDPEMEPIPEVYNPYHNERDGGHYYGAPNSCLYIFRLKVIRSKEAPAREVKTEEAEEEDVGPYYEEDNEAWGFDGVWPFAIPLSVIGALVGYTLTKGKRKEEEEELPDKREMHIYKEFGDSLLVGDEPQQVFAKIVRKTKGGEVTDPVLTELIKIHSGDGYMQVSEGEMQGDWKTAWISTPETSNGSEPEEGIVTFSMMNDKGGYTNRLHFRIEAGKVLFGQENLTLPAHYEKEVRLPFVVLGMDGSSGVTASIVNATGAPTTNYDVQVEWNEKERLYYAVIHDKVLDKEADKGVPGKYLTYTLHIEAKSHSGRLIEGRLHIYRYYMGLRFDVKDIYCFIEEYNPLNHASKKFAATQKDGTIYVPAETKAHLKLYDYDEEQHKLLEICPVPIEFSIKTQDESKQYMVDKMALQLDAKGNRQEKDGTFCLLRCCRAVLDAPNRLSATVQVTVMHKGEKVTCEQGVRLCSQPVRQFSDNRDWNLAVKEDERITERLDHIEKEIYRLHLVDNLFPLLKYINMVREGYHSDYGYDPKTIKTIVTTYTDVMTGRKAGANADPPKPLTLADDFQMFCVEWFNTAKKVEKDMGFMTRLFVGVCTLGCADVVFTAVEVIDNMKEYVDNGGDSVWGGFCVGAKVVVREYITEKAMGYGMEKLGKMAKEAGLTPENMKKAAGEMLEGVKNPFSSTTKGGPLKNAVNNSRRAGAKATGNATRALENVKGAPKTHGKRDLTEAIEFGKARAKQNVEDLQAACDLYKMNPTPENLKLRNDLIMKCQSDKQTMFMLKNGDSSLNATRKDFNKHLKEIYDKTDDMVMGKLQAEYGGEIKVGNASSSNQLRLKDGTTVTFDRDITYYRKNAQGEWVAINNQDQIEKLYKETFYENATGIKKTDASKLAELRKEGVDISKYQDMEKRLTDSYGTKMDQTNIQDVLGHKESYGTKGDLDKVLKNELHGQALSNPTKVGDTVTYKGMERFDRAEALLKEADSITDPLEKVAKQADAIGEMMEGCRQEFKVFDNFVNSRDMYRFDVNGGSMIPQKLRDAVKTVEPLINGQKDMMEVEKALASHGYTLEGFAQAMGDAVKAIG